MQKHPYKTAWHVSNKLPLEVLSKKKKAKLRRKKYLDYTIYVDLLAHRFNTTKIYYDGSFSIKKITFVQNLFIYETRSIPSSRLFPARRTTK